MLLLALSFSTPIVLLTLPPWMVGQRSFEEAQIGGGAEEWAHLSAATLAKGFPVLISAAFAQRLLGGTIVSHQ